MMKIELTEKRINDAIELISDAIDSLELSNVEIVFICEAIKLGCYAGDEEED